VTLATNAETNRFSGRRASRASQRDAAEPMLLTPADVIRRFSVSLWLPYVVSIAAVEQALGG